MARLWYSGAEFADHTAEGLTAGSGSVTYDTGTVRAGSRAFKVDAGAGNAVQHVYRDFNGAVGTAYYARVYVRLPADITTSAYAFAVQDSAGANIVRVRIQASTLRFQLFDSASTVLASGPVTSSVDTWYRVEVKVKVGVGATDECELLVDGTSYGALTAQTLSDNAPDRLAFGWLTAPGASKVAFFEDVAINDDTGADENGYPGDGKVLILLPTADAAVGTGWTVGNGSTAVSTNLFGGVDNVPPAGVADAAGAASQIRNAANTSTANYDATTQTTLAAGMPSGANIRVLQVVGVFGCSSTTATSAGIGTTGVSPNTGVATVAADTGVVAGTHPTGWARRESTLVYNPTTSTPGVRVGKRTGTTRVVLCSLAAILLDYRDPVTITAAAANATGATGAAVGVVQPVPTAAAATGAGVAPVGRFTYTAPVATATASGVAPVGIVRPVPPAALGVGTGVSPTGIVTKAGAAGLATASGVAPVGIAMPVAVASFASGSAAPPNGIVVGVASAAIADGSTGAPTGVVVIVATAGAAVGFAPAPTLEDQPVVIPVPAAFGTAAAIAPDASVVAVAGSAVAVGSAVVPVSWITIAGATGFANGAATAGIALVVVVPTAGFAVGDAIVPGWSGAVPVVIYLPTSATWRRVAGPSAVLVSSRARAALAAQPHPSAGLATSRPSADVVGVPFPSATLTKGDQP